jgi:hypothetical protein
MRIKIGYSISTLIVFFVDVRSDKDHLVIIPNGVNDVGDSIYDHIFKLLGPTLIA